MAYNLEPRTIKENLLGLIGKNPHAEPRPANTREECFLADIAENGGGGSSLPPYTSADKGKVLTVGEGSESETVVIVPEQTVTLSPEGFAVLSNVVDDLFTAGRIVNMTVDNETASGEIVGDGLGLAVNITHESLTWRIGKIDELGGFVFQVVDENEDPVPGTYTVSLTTSVPSVEPKWEKGNIVIPVSNQITTMMNTRLQTEIPKAITAGIGVPVYHGAVTEEAVDGEEWDETTALIKESVMKGIVLLSYLNSTNIVIPTGVSYDSQYEKHVVDGFSMKYTTGNYVLKVEFSVVLMKNPNLSNRKEVGLTTIVTLLYVQT